MFKLLRIVAFSIILFSFSRVAAQSYKAMPYSQKVLDTTVIRLYYQFNYAKDPDHKSDKSMAMTVLEVGNQYLKFTDYFRRRADSVSRAYYKKVHYSEQELEALMQLLDKVRYDNTVVMNLKTGKMIYQGRIQSLYQYSKKTPQLDWKLLDSTKKIKNRFTVQKAITTYGGRDWVAWFNIEGKQPYPYGSYIFKGLPGLIFEVYDTEDNFHFTLVGGDNQKKVALYLRNEDRIKKTTEKKYRRLNKAYHRHPSAFIKAKAWSSDGTPIEIPAKPYNPIERD